MRPFWRALRYVWPMRYAVVLAWACAVLVAVLYFCSIGSVLPLLQILFGEQGGATITTHVVPDPGDPDREVERPCVVVPQDFTVERVPADGAVRLERETRTLYVPEGYDLVPGGLEYFVTRSQGAWYHGAVAWAVGALPRTRQGQLAALMVLVVILTAARCLMKFLNGWIVGYTISRTVLAIQHRAFDCVLRLPMRFFQRGGASEANARLIHDAFALREGMQSIFGKVVLEPLRAMAALALAVVCAVAIDWRLLVLVFLFGPLCAVAIRKFAGKMRRVTKKAMQAAARILGILEESLAALHVVKAYSMEGRERRRFFHQGRQYLRMTVKAFKTQAATSPTLEFLGTLAVAAAVVLGAYILQQRGGQDQRLLLTFFAAMVGTMDPLRKLANVHNRLQAANNSAERLFELIDAEPESRRGTEGITLGRLREVIAFEDVHFRYERGAGEVLRGISLRVEAGETVAVVGRTGCGKTTLVNLLPRFYSPTSGRVTVDGTDVQAVTLRSLRGQIGIVSQQTILFSDTIAGNIAYGAQSTRRGRGDVSRDEIVEAARKAHADEFIQTLPDGYDTELGTLGQTLSGGQRQRLALARAIIRDPAILILDEATSALDEETQALVQDTLERFVQGRTVFVIAHRLSTLALARRIVVMDDGRLVDVGAHRELVGRCEVYRRLRETAFETE